MLISLLRTRNLTLDIYTTAVCSPEPVLAIGKVDPSHFRV